VGEAACGLLAFRLLGPPVIGLEVEHMQIVKSCTTLVASTIQIHDAAALHSEKRARVHGALGGRSARRYASVTADLDVLVAVA
jgi:hypothetical protein